MKLFVLGSGSRGNAIAVTAGGVTLLVDAGFGGKTLMSRVESAGLDADSIAGVVLTHEHGDHSRGASSIARKTGCPVYASRGTLTALADKLRPHTRVAVDPQEAFAIGPFTIDVCRTVHDASEPLAVSVTGPVGRAKIGLAYDLGRPTAAVRYMLRGCTCLLIEANHDEVMLRTGSYPPSVRNRIAGSHGHLSNRAAGELLAELCHKRLKSVVLVHMSERCNNADLASARVQSYLDRAGFGGELLVAPQHETLGPVNVADEPAQFELLVGA